MIKDNAGEIIELRCSYYPDTLGANPEGRKVRDVIHWVSATLGVKAEIRLYDRLFSHPTPDADKTVESFIDHLNPDSLYTLTHATEKYLAKTLSLQCLLRIVWSCPELVDIYEVLLQGFFITHFKGNIYDKQPTNGGNYGGNLYVEVFNKQIKTIS